MSYGELLTCGDTRCLTSCHLRFVSKSCHFLNVTDSTASLVSGFGCSAATAAHLFRHRDGPALPTRHAYTGVSKQLVLGLSDVEFFGSEGFAALHYVSVHCARHDVDWLFIGGRTMRRIVAICDPDAELPLADAVAAALARLDHLGRCRHAVQSAGRRPLQDHAIPASGRSVATATA